MAGSLKTSPRSAAGQTMLAQPYYTAVEAFERDRQLFHRHWHCLGHWSELPAVGDYLVRKLVDAEVVVTRPETNRCAALHNVCSHRALRLCDQPHGSTKGTLRCPYHGWSYDLDGRLVAAPNMSASIDGDGQNYGLVEVAVEIWQGLIFASLRPRENLQTMLDPLQPLVANWNLNELSIARTLNYEVAANWKLIVQNFSECYHCPIVHPQLNRLTPFRSAENQLTEGGPVMGGPMLLEPDAQTMSLNGRYASAPFTTLSEEQRRRVYYYSIFPTTFVSPHPDYVLLHRLVPQAVDRTEVICQLLTLGSPADQAQFEQAVEFWDQTNRQDWAMCERSQQGVSSPGFRPGPYSDLESLLAAFDRYYLAQLA